MIASEQQPYRCGEREPTVRPVGGKPLVTGVRFNALRQIVQIAQRMQAEAFVAHAHLSRIEAHIFEYGPRAPAQGQVAAEKAVHCGVPAISSVVRRSRRNRPLSFRIPTA